MISRPELISFFSFIFLKLKKSRISPRKMPRAGKRRPLLSGSRHRKFPRSSFNRPTTSLPRPSSSMMRKRCRNHPRETAPLLPLVAAPLLLLVTALLLLAAVPLSPLSAGLALHLQGDSRPISMR
jgi:hypothetical protein